ncbi:MAG: hypothetical protein WBB45_19695 [Cyclobacteriaceae bacterium]
MNREEEIEFILSELRKMDIDPIHDSSYITYNTEWGRLYKLAKDFEKFIQAGLVRLDEEYVLIKDYYFRLRDIAFNLGRKKRGREIQQEGYAELGKLHREVFEGKYIEVVEEDGKKRNDFPLVPYDQNILFLATRLRAEYLQTELETILSEKGKLEKLRTTMEDAAKAQLSARYVQTFQEEAEKHRKFYTQWLKAGVATVLLFAGLFPWLSDLFVPNFENLNKQLLALDMKVTEPSIYLFANLFSRLLYVSLGIFLIRFCFRQYSLQRHLYTENTHKAKALDSFKLFVESVSPEDKDTRHTLVLELAKAIFENRPTGYLGAKAEANDPKVSLTDLMKIMPKSNG